MSKINQRQNFATELVHSPREKYKLLFDVAPVGLVEGIWSKSFEVIAVNQAALDIFKAESKVDFVQAFPKVISKIPPKIFLELLSARVKADFFEAELPLQNLEQKNIAVFMRLVYMPAAHAQSPQHVVLAFFDITKRAKDNSLLKKLSQLDGLTRVLNRRAIVSRLDEEISRAKRYNLSLSCVIFDLDNFKAVNDNLGHLWGDKCLKNTVASLKKSLRKTDIIGRLGGDEFLVILPETTPSQAIVPVERFIHDPQIETTYEKKGKSVRISFSVGISGYPAANIHNAKDLIEAADKALYLSKTSGGSRFQIHAPHQTNGKHH